MFKCCRCVGAAAGAVVGCDAGAVVGCGIVVVAECDAGVVVGCDAESLSYLFACLDWRIYGAGHF